MTARNYGSAIKGFIAVVILCAGCSSKSENPADSTGASTSSEALPADVRPDTLPVMLNRDLPFRYPPVLYAEKTQGNVTLRLYIDRTGKVVSESTHVAESSKVPTLDSAAMKGARELRFTPAKLDGAPVAVSILFPVYFRHPEALPPPGDTVLKKMMPAGSSQTSRASVAPTGTVNQAKH